MRLYISSPWALSGSQEATWHQQPPFFLCPPFASMVILSMMNQRNYFKPHSLIEGGEDGERELTRKKDCSVPTAPKVKRSRKKGKINSAVTSPSIKHTHTHAHTRMCIHTHTHLYTECCTFVTSFLIAAFMFIQTGLGTQSAYELKRTQTEWTVSSQLLSHLLSHLLTQSHLWVTQIIFGPHDLLRRCSINVCWINACICATYRHQA